MHLVGWSDFSNDDLGRGQWGKPSGSSGSLALERNLGVTSHMWWLVPVALLIGTLGESAHGMWKDWILDELNLQGLEDWPEEEQNQARELLTRWEHLFSHSDLDQGKMSLIRHQIELTDQMPFKECYWQIPPYV